MADISVLIYAQLVGHAGTNALIDGRCYPDILPQKAAQPSISYQEISHVRASDGSADIFRVRQQIDCWATTRSAANSVRTQAKLALRGQVDKSAGLIYMLDDGGFVDYESDTALYRASFDVLATVCE